jgi:hypothetical protein
MTSARRLKNKHNLFANEKFLKSCKGMKTKFCLTNSAHIGCGILLQVRAKLGTYVCLQTQIKWNHTKSLCFV